jgi:hypothetical protein
MPLFCFNIRVCLFSLMSLEDMFSSSRRDSSAPAGLVRKGGVLSRAIPGVRLFKAYGLNTISTVAIYNSRPTLWIVLTLNQLKSDMAYPGSVFETLTCFVVAGEGLPWKLLRPYGACKEGEAY